MEPKMTAKTRHKATAGDDRLPTQCEMSGGEVFGDG
jgi:hypothetical protein